MVKNLVAWRRTNKGSLFFGVLSLGLFYAFASLAIDTGSLLHYAIAIGLLVIGFRDIGVFVKTSSTSHDKTKKRSRKKA